MKDMKGTKRSCSPSAEGSPSPSDVKTPPAHSGFPWPPGSPSEISSHHPHSPVFEQGGPSGIVSVINLSSSMNEEDFVVDTSRDAEFAKRLLGDLNCDILGPPDDGKVIILNDSNEEEEVHEETTVDVVPFATEKSLTLVASAVDADEDP
jgi:hypothetical protein